MTTYAIPERYDATADLRQTYHEIEPGPSAGPCATCAEPVIYVKARQHNNHRGYEYDMHFDFLQIHADPALLPHDGRVTNVALPQCEKCNAHGTIVYTQEAYGDRVRCTACGRDDFYSIGD